MRTPRERAPGPGIDWGRDLGIEMTLNAETLPAFVIDATSAQLVDANAAARALLGLSTTTPFPYALDSAMPALSQLRTLSDKIDGSATRERLTFWCNGRPLPLTCDIRQLTKSGEHRQFALRCTPVGGQALEVEDIAQPLANPLASNPTELRAGQSDPEPPGLQHEQRPTHQDDMQTLKDIARQIREGQLVFRAAALSAAEARLAAETRLAAQNAHSVPARAEPIPLQPRPEPRPMSPSDLAQLAHELKTPLTAIAAAAEIMRDERLGAMSNAKYLGYAADIHDSASHALAVITTMLTMPGVASEADARDADFDLNDLVERTLSALQPLAHAKGLDLAFEPEDGAPRIAADPTAVRQILLNLVTNALKFTPHGGDVRVVTGYLANGAPFLVVRDTGPGMDEGMDEGMNEVMDEGMDDELVEDMDDDVDVEVSLDEPGQPRTNGHASRTSSARPGGGSGIGLPLVRDLAARMGAAVEIDSAPGKGTVVLLAFPRHAAR